MNNLKYVRNILILVLVPLGIYLEPIFSINLINEENWRYIFILKGVCDLLVMSIFLLGIRNVYRSKEIYFRKLFGFVFLLACIVFFAFSFFNTTRDLMLGPSTYEGKCELNRYTSRFSLNSNSMYLVEESYKFYILINSPTYESLSGIYIGAGSGNTYICNKPVTIEYLPFSRMLIT